MPGESHGQRRLAGYSPWGHIESDMTEVTEHNTHKLKIELPYDPAIPLLDKSMEKSMVRKDTCTPMFIAALFTISKTGKQPTCSLTEE